MRRATYRHLVLLVLPLLVLASSGCLFPGGSSGRSDRIYTTNTGARGQLNGSVEAIATDIEEVFRFLNIQWSGQSSLGDGTEIRGYSGNDQVTIRLRSTADDYTRIEVRVKEPGAEIGTGRDRWDREAARFILSEIRKWRAG